MTRWRWSDGSRVHPVRQTVRYVVSRFAANVLARAYVRIRLEGREHLPPGPVLYCANHQNWADPFLLGAALPWWPRLYFFGPKEEDMRVGGRNRLMTWTGAAVPYKPGKNDLLEVTRRVQAVFTGGSSLLTFAEGRIHSGEGHLLPLSDGAAYFALRCSVPLVPVAINGSSWLRFGRIIRVRLGEPIEASGRPTRAAVSALTLEATEALRALVRDYPDPAPPGPFGRWFTDVFNEWPPGGRPPPGTDSGILPGRQEHEEDQW